MKAQQSAQWKPKRWKLRTEPTEELLNSGKRENLCCNTICELSIAAEKPNLWKGKARNSKCPRIRMEIGSRNWTQVELIKQVMETQQSACRAFGRGRAKGSSHWRAGQYPCSPHLVISESRIHISVQVEHYLFLNFLLHDNENGLTLIQFFFPLTQRK